MIKSNEYISKQFYSFWIPSCPTYDFFLKCQFLATLAEERLYMELTDIVSLDTAN